MALADPRLQVPVVPLPASQPVVDALQRLNRDVGSVQARIVAGKDDLPADMRLIAVVVVDDADFERLAAGLRRELASNPAALALSDHVFVNRIRLDCLIVIFLDVLAVG